MFCVRVFMSWATRATSSMPLASNTSSTPSAPSSAEYCRESALRGSVRMRIRSACESASSSTRMGKRPCSSGKRSLTFARWKAPAAMNRTWSVFTGPYFVFTVLPSTMGSRSRCTPPRDTSGPCDWPAGSATLSISSMKTIPFDCTRSSASRATVSLSTSFSASSCARTRRASGTESLRFLLFLPNGRFPSISCRLRPISSMPCDPKICIVGAALSCTSTSTVRSSRPPARSIPRSFSRVESREPGRRRSSRRSSASSSARGCTSFCRSSRTRETPASTRSRIIESTSLPTYPTSVNFEASTLTNGAPASRASRRAISVFPTPVGPTRMMFFGITSSRISGVSRNRRQRLRSAMATARLAAACPTI